MDSFPISELGEDRMPFRGTSAMDHEREFVGLAMSEGGQRSRALPAFRDQSDDRIQMAFAPSRPGFGGADRASRRPKTSPGRTPAAIEAKVGEVKKKKKKKKKKSATAATNVWRAGGRLGGPLAEFTAVDGAIAISRGVRACGDEQGQTLRVSSERLSPLRPAARHADGQRSAVGRSRRRSADTASG